ncbi:unnamed protein product [Caenorhabditis nigoni]
MQFSKIVFFFFVFVSVVVSSFGVHAFSLESKASHLKAIVHDFEEMEEKQAGVYAEMYKEIYGIKEYARKLRGRRGLDCGSKVLEKVIQVCGVISTNSEINIASKCCSGSCTDEYYRKNVCPEK